MEACSRLNPSRLLTASIGTYDVYTIHSIINTTSVLHVSFPSTNSSDPFPNVASMIGVMGSYSHPSADLSEPLDCYLHGYVSSGLMKAARANPETGLPLTISATKVDGLVLSLTPNSHSYNYRSAVLFGYGSLVEDIDEKLWAMELVTNSVVPERWSNARLPPDAGEMASTTLMRVRIVSGSGKIRDGGPHDDKKDIERADVVDKVWTGVIPVYQTLGEPIRCGDGKVSEVPEYVRSFCEDVNEENENYAKTAAKS